MALSRSKTTPIFSTAQANTFVHGLIQGAAAAPPVVAPTTFSATSAKGFMPRSTNYVSPVAADITRSGVGAYTVKFIDGLPIVIDIDPNVWGPNGTTATISDYNPTTKIVTILVWSVVGAAVDLTAAEFLRFTITGQDEIPPY